VDASDFYKQGRLAEAVAAATEEVKKRPAESGPRGFLAELLCVTGNLERADLQLDALGRQDPQTAPQIALWRQVVRAETARRQLWTDGRVPEFLGEPTPALKALLAAVVAVREGRPADAMELVGEADAVRPRVRGKAGEVAFEDFRDLDDLMSGHLEVLTTTGKYYWIPTERVESIEFRPPTRARDLVWRKAQMTVKDGPDGEVFIPATYAGSATDDDLSRLGRRTDWTAGEGAPVRGTGQRTFLIGEEAMPIMLLGAVRFEGAGV
jgi:type VI secretion system protein ImpE